MMILEAIIDIFLAPIFWIIDLLPSIGALPSWITDTLTIIGYGLNIFPADVWLVVLINIGIWIVGLFVWAVIEWIYKKIPGVD